MGKKLVDPDRLCMGCMAELNQNISKCPYCGFQEKTYQKPANSLPLREILHGKYLIGRVIGSGGFGITYIAWDFYQSKKVCIKEYFPRLVATRNPHAKSYSDLISVSLYCTTTHPQDPARLQQIYQTGLESYIQEARILSGFYLTPGIVSIRDFFYRNNTAYIVMEYIDGIDMKKYAKFKGGRLSVEEVFPILKDVLKALDQVHRVNIIHRDISPDNIMISREGKAKLIDFGSSKNYVIRARGSVVLKKGYAPIEQYYRDGKQGPWTDVYSISATIYYLLTGVRIPEAKERQEKDTVRLLQAMGVPVSCRQDEAIRRGLSISAGRRYQRISDLYMDLYGEHI
jgi:serine/threonine protein kinase